MAALSDISLNIEMIAGGQPKVTREITFTNGDKVTFVVTLDRDDSATLPNLHKQSVREVISRLEALITPK